jgi:hypothetical protein
MVVADESRVVHCIGKANIDGELTIAEDLSVCWHQKVWKRFLLEQAPNAVPETGVIIMYPEAKRSCVFCHYRGQI